MVTTGMVTYISLKPLLYSSFTYKVRVIPQIQVPVRALLDYNKSPPFLVDDARRERDRYLLSDIVPIG